MTALALLTASALLTGCGGVGAEDAVEAEEPSGRTEAAFVEGTCNSTTADAFVSTYNFPKPGATLSTATPFTYGKAACTRAFILDVHQPAGTQNIRFTSTWNGTVPTTKVACEAIRLSTRSGDSITPLIAPLTRPGVWNGSSCSVPSILDAYNGFIGRARLVVQATNSSGNLVSVRIQIKNPG